MASSAAMVGGGDPQGALWLGGGDPQGALWLGGRTKRRRHRHGKSCKKH